MGEAADVVLGADVLGQYVAFSRFNSPYPAHERGRAIDLYPATGAPSPVDGEVVETLTVRAPDRPYAADEDHVIVVDTGEHLARLLHVQPSVDVGDRVEVGDPLGALVRSGYFAPWVDDHLHLGFRPRGANPIRASGSLAVAVAAPVVPVPWDGTGTVIERGDTYAILDAPEHPAAGDGFAAIAADGRGDRPGRALDGGLPHYDGGGFADGALEGDAVERPIELLGATVGRANDGVVAWADVTVHANGTPVTGLSLSCQRGQPRAKLVSWDGVPARVGERVDVGIRPTASA